MPGIAVWVRMGAIGALHAGGATTSSSRRQPGRPHRRLAGPGEVLCSAALGRRRAQLGYLLEELGPVFVRDLASPCRFCAPTGSRPMAEWIYFLHAPRENFAATMTAEEQAVWAVHFDRLRRLMDEGIMIAVGPTLGRINTGTAIFEAPDEEAARKIMEDDPVVKGGFANGELRPFRLSLLRGRD